MAPKRGGPTEATPLTGDDLASITDISIRHGFVQKVFGILGLQLLATFLVGGLVTYYGEALRKQYPNMVVVLVVVSLAILLSIHCVFICHRETMRKSPQNYVLLSIFTLAKGILIGFICSEYSLQSVLVLVAITSLVCLGLMVFACQTTYDFTGWLPYFCAASLVLMMMMLAICISRFLGLASSGAFQVLYIVYASFGALLSSFGIILHTQMIVGGKNSQHRHA
eukprot:Skav205135  [mRNA]  locus=scaffold3411:133897:136423:- [translate_table: standard]